MSEKKPDLWLPENPKPVTPYALRFDILKLARDHLVEEYHSNIVNGTPNKVCSCGENCACNNCPPKPSFPKFADIKKLADQMKAFVDTK